MLITGVSIALGPLLRQIPISVLFGVFLYMGVNSLIDDDIQFWDRFLMYFTPVKHHPNVAYVRRVSIIYSQKGITQLMSIHVFIKIICRIAMQIVDILETKSVTCFAYPGPQSYGRVRT